MESFYTGFQLAVGACAGMVTWQAVAFLARIGATVAAAIHARIFGPTFRDGKGQIVRPNGKKDGSK